MESSNRLFRDRDLDDATQESADRIADAKREHRPTMTLLLLSGGNDSMVLLDRAAHEADAVVHVDTGIGISETTDFVREVCRERKLRLIEGHPPVPYDDLVLGAWNGFPGNHTFAYAQLKDKAIREVLKGLRTAPTDTFMLLTGLRKAESKNRARRYNGLDVQGRSVWVNPLFSWTNEEMHEYRRAAQLPKNPVSKEMHMSGECLCGARARPGEREEWLFWRPDFIKGRIEPLEAEVRRRGLPWYEWGWPNNNPELVRKCRLKPDPAQGDLFAEGDEFMPMCVGCDMRMSAEEAPGA